MGASPFGSAQHPAQLVFKIIHMSPGVKKFISFRAKISGAVCPAHFGRRTGGELITIDPAFGLVYAPFPSVPA